MSNEVVESFYSMKLAQVLDIGSNKISLKSLDSFIKDPVVKLGLETPKNKNKIRIVCISDTHSKIDCMSHRIPDADILIHAGDFTRRGTLDEIEAFDSYLASLKNIEHKIVIAGNHEIYLDARFCGKESQRIKARDKLRNCIYLEDDHVELYGYKIYGSPWQPIHVGNAFQLERGSKLRAKWNKIPSDTDILVTHGPPLGYGDRVGSTRNVGCEDLLDEVKNRIKPKYHIFGHIHEDHGAWTDGTTTFINACICNSKYNPIYEPIIFDIDLKNSPS